MVPGKKGVTPKIGVTFVISVHTGETLDYAVKSLFCHGCKARNSMDKESREDMEWKKAHEPSCEHATKPPNKIQEKQGQIREF